MGTSTVNPPLSEYLAQLRDVTEIRDANGKVLGYFAPAEKSDLSGRAPASDLSEAGVAAVLSSTWPPNYFAKTAGAFADQPFERPAQGTMPDREIW